MHSIIADKNATGHFRCKGCDSLPMCPENYLCCSCKFIYTVLMSVRSFNFYCNLVYLYCLYIFVML